MPGKEKTAGTGMLPLFQRFSGGAEGTRTPDPLHAMQVRYQLRHSPGFTLANNHLRRSNLISLNQISR
jgi:hypothetical protein